MQFITGSFKYMSLLKNELYASKLKLFARTQHFFSLHLLLTSAQSMGNIKGGIPYTFEFTTTMLEERILSQSFFFFMRLKIILFRGLCFLQPLSSATIESTLQQKAAGKESPAGKGNPASGIGSYPEFA